MIEQGTEPILTCVFFGLESKPDPDILIELSWAFKNKKKKLKKKQSKQSSQT